MAADLEQTDSVFDFLYVDHRRLSILLTQFGVDGVLTELVRGSEDAAETGGGVSLAVGKADHKRSGKTSLARKFDPRWLLPLNFLDTAQGWLCPDVIDARVGQLVLLKVGVGVIDVGFMKRLWEIPFVQQSIAATIPQENLADLPVNRAARRRDKSGPKGTDTSPLTDFVGSLMGMMPHAVQATFVTEKGEVLWGTLDEEHLTGSATDIMLKHGHTLAGEWHLVGILDAMPKGSSFEELRNRVEIEQSGSQLFGILQHFGPMLELGYSRPPHAYGVTPLIVMRAIAP
ncbi:hypothetical protein [Caulobacter segnis]|uniref:Uncharacterized protein n=1 Tax=Caulobacter segnis TaxID=88688 RepID=A0A2W5VKA2_9CAUL|nr:hypothetical protein [Caulobacter segnis]PZR37176.1 MAG: hypothetical protein DI526_01280 [Caulobacter segnis]